MREHRTKTESHVQERSNIATEEISPAPADAGSVSFKGIQYRHGCIFYIPSLSFVKYSSTRLSGLKRQRQVRTAENCSKATQASGVSHHSDIVNNTNHRLCWDGSDP